jgi:glucose/arabinose dehydrogenase
MGKIPYLILARLAAKEIPMEKTITKITLLLAALLLACFAPAVTHAQAETAPEDYNKAANMAPVAPAPNVKPDFEGTFSLPNQVQCHGHKLAPGKYTLAVKTVGETKMLTLQHEGSEVVVQVKNASPASTSGQSAVMVRHGPGPRSWTLEEIYVENLKMVFTIDDSGHTGRLDKMFASVKRVPIT